MLQKALTKTSSCTGIRFFCDKYVCGLIYQKTIAKCTHSRIFSTIEPFQLISVLIPSLVMPLLQYEAITINAPPLHACLHDGLCLFRPGT